MLSILLGLAVTDIRAGSDWLVKPGDYKAKIVARMERTIDSYPATYELDNGLVKRVFSTKHNGATIAIDNQMTGQAMLRAVEPEAILTIDGEAVVVGGMSGQPDHAYLRPEWLDYMKPLGPFQFGGINIVPIDAPFPWKRGTSVASAAKWPAVGTSLVQKFRGNGKWSGIEVTVHHEIYDGLPMLCKWIEIKNNRAHSIRLGSFTSERLAIVERESIVDSVARWELPNISVISDYSFGGMNASNSTHTTYWGEDPNYPTQVNYEHKTPCLLESKLPIGPDVDIASKGIFKSFRTFELYHDSDDRERKGLAIRKMMRMLAPWVSDNPLMLHLTSTNPTLVKRAIDQCAEVGFEMVIFSFGSGLNMEDTSALNIQKFQQYADYAHSKGMRIGGYSLLASRRINDEEDVVNPKTGKTGGSIFGNSPCLGSRWADGYFQNITKFLTQTKFDLLEHDGSYPGDVCASISHPGHHGLNDSQWTQFQRIATFYQWCRSRNIFLNVPDFYFLNGSNKTGMGYRESNWSLPRAEQHIHARQNIFDGTWDKTPSMGWMFTPLVEYQGGGQAATIEPLKDHLPDYEQHLANNLGAGVQSCYRGPRLFDTPETKAKVTKWVQFYKRHRAILESDIVHLRRADGHNVDGLLHVNPTLKECGFAVYYNPGSVAQPAMANLPLRYTGAVRTVKLTFSDGRSQTAAVGFDGKVKINLLVPAKGTGWVMIER